MQAMNRVSTGNIDKHSFYIEAQDNIGLGKCAF